MKQRIFIVLIGLVVVGIGAFLSWQTPSKKPSQPEPIVRVAAQPPAITLVPDSPTNVVFSFEGTPPSFPKTLPVYQFSFKRYSETEISSIATSLGFVALPIKKTVSGASKYSWSDKQSSLSYFVDTASSSWSYSSFTGSAPLSQPTNLSSYVKDVLINTFSYPPSLSLSLYRQTSGPFDGLQTDMSNNTTLLGFSFTTLVNGAYPVVSDGFEVTPISAIVDSRGGIRSFVFTPPPAVSTETDAPLLSLSDAIDSLNNNLGVLVFSGSSTANVFWGEPPLFKTVALTDVQLIYYPNKQTGKLTPFFLFDGSATTDSGSTLLVRYAISAIE